MAQRKPIADGRSAPQIHASDNAYIDKPRVGARKSALEAELQPPRSPYLHPRQILSAFPSVTASPQASPPSAMAAPSICRSFPTLRWSKSLPTVVASRRRSAHCRNALSAARRAVRQQRTAAAVGRSAPARPALRRRMRGTEPNGAAINVRAGHEMPLCPG